ncbi:MAG: pilus assembly protein [Candidatus Tectimicrobiota bacterium]
MTTRKSLRRRVGLLTLGGWCGITTLALAAPLDLLNVPIYLSSAVEPNVLLVIDDSGSMDWEVITRDFANDGRYTGTQPDGTSPAGAGSVRHRDSDDDGRSDCGFGVLGGQTIYGYAYGVEFATNTYTDDTRDCNTADEEEWRFRNSDFNLLYFDPLQTYLPWEGLDAAGQPYQNMDIRAAKDNPYDPNSLTIDLTQHNANWIGATNTRASSDRDGDGRPDGFRYYTWQDRNSNGLFDDGEETAHLIRDAPASVQQNFANWFSYYRKREYVTKAVYSRVIAGASRVRMGLATLNRNRNGINTAVTSPDTPLRSMEPDPTRGNKRALLDALFSIHGEAGTPLRTILRRAGQYFEGASDRLLFPSDNAYLTAAQGGACQQSFVLMMTDGFDNGTASPRVGNADGDRNSAFDGGQYADAISNTLADVAMAYYERDLRTDLPNQLSTSLTDPAPHQHMITYTITFSGLGGSLNSDPAPNVNGNDFWPNPFDNDQYKLDDLRHAAFNGRGQFFQARDVTSLTEALDRVFISIAQRVSSAAAVSLNTGSRSTESRVYQARFDSTDWSGQLLSTLLDEHGVPSQHPGDTLDAGALLDTRLRNSSYDTSVRTILTWKPSTRIGIPLQWNLLDSAQQSLLHTDSSGRVDNYGQARLNYLRGSNVDEVPAPQGKDFRPRLHRLGDIINANPYFVDTPQLSDAVDPSGAYALFRERYAARTKMIVVGSNDGMLHIFNANDPVTSTNAQGDPQAGQEILAYVPNSVMGRLSALTAPDYRTQHQYYVDGSPIAGDVVLTPPGGSPGWHTVVVSGLRSGGQGYFALDITDPTLFQETAAAARNLVLWEFSDAQDADLGFTFSTPQIVQMANGKWAAVFGNGYNNTEADGYASTTGHAVLFIVFLDPPQGPWVEGQHYIKIDTGSGDVTTPNGLATPAVVDLDGDTRAEYIVAGDLRGNLWHFDVTSQNPTDWAQPANRSRLFVATDSNGTPQPITTRPEVGVHPESLGGFVVYVGTGKYLERGDNTTVGTTTQSFYGIWDRQGQAVARSDLLQQTFSTATTVRDVNGVDRMVRITSDNPIDWQRQRGWYIDLPAPGERQVSDSVLRNGRILFTTLIPNEQICGFGGSGFLVALDVNGGVRPPTTIFDVNRDRILSAADNAASGDPSGTPPSSHSGVINALQSDVGILGAPTIQASGTTDTLYISGSTGALGQIEANPGPAAVGRQAWRQVTQ